MTIDRNHSDRCPVTSPIFASRVSIFCTPSIDPVGLGVRWGSLSVSALVQVQAASGRKWVYCQTDRGGYTQLSLAELGHFSKCGSRLSAVISFYMMCWLILLIVNRFVVIIIVCRICFLRWNYILFDKIILLPILLVNLYLTIGLFD